MLTFEVPLHRLRSGNRMVFAKQRPPAPVSRPTALQQKLALGHRIVRAVGTGEVKDFMDAAHQMGVSDAWVSMLVSLTFLAPGIQEEVLIPKDGAPRIQSGQALQVSREADWGKQKKLLAELLSMKQPKSTAITP